jgi:hypothetical protein
MNRSAAQGDQQADPRRRAADGGSLENDADLNRIPAMSAEALYAVLAMPSASGA